MYPKKSVCDNCGGHGRSAIDSDDGWVDMKIHGVPGCFSMCTDSCLAQNFVSADGSVEHREVHFCSYECEHSYMRSVANKSAADSAR